MSEDQAEKEGRFEPCGEDVRKLLDDIIADYRDDLLDAQPKIRLLFALKPLRNRGKIVGGKCKVHNEEDKARGTADATITLDVHHWNSLTERRRKALVHHELSHVDAWGGERDAAGRPRLRGCYGDWENDGFDEVVRIYGDDSPERIWLAQIQDRLRQPDLPGTEPPPPEPRSAEGLIADAANALISVGWDKADAVASVQQAAESGRAYDTAAGLVDIVLTTPRPAPPPAEDKPKRRRKDKAKGKVEEVAAEA